MKAQEETSIDEASGSNVYPLMSPEERASLWREAAGSLNGRGGQVIEEMEKLRNECDHESSPT